MNEYLSVTQYCEKYGLDKGNVRRLIAAGRISAVKIGAQWAIPADEPKPDDNRIKTGKYKNWRTPKNS